MAQWRRSVKTQMTNSGLKKKKKKKDSGGQNTPEIAVSQHIETRPKIITFLSPNLRKFSHG
jgi:hypothetical protein